MARVRTLQDMMDEVRDGADVDDDFIDNTLLIRLINTKLAGLFRHLVNVNKDFFVEGPTVIPTVSGTATIAVPVDFFRILAVDRQSSGNWYNVPRFDLPQRNMFQDESDPNATRYRMLGTTIRLTPTPSSVFNVRLWYCPAPPVLSLAGISTWDGFAGYEEMATLDSIIALKLKQDEDVSGELVVRRAVVDDILASASERDDAEPDLVRDVDLEVVNRRDFGDWGA